MANKKRVSLYVVLGLLLSLIIACGVYVAYFALSHKALPGTKVGAVSVTGKTQTQIARQLSNAQQNNKVTFQGDNVADTTVSLDEVGYTVDAQQTAKDALRLNTKPWAYLTGLFTTHTIEPTYSTDPAKTNALSSKLSEQLPGAKAATEPTVVNKENTAEFEVVSGKDGVGVDTKSLLEGANEVISQLQNVSYQVRTGAIAPLASQEEAQALADKAVAMTKQQVALKVGDETVNPDPTKIASWLLTDNVLKDAKPSIDEEAVLQWIDSVKGKIEVEKVDGFRYTKENSGEVLKISKELKDGVKVNNEEAVAKDIVSKLEAGEAYSGALTTETEKAEWKEKVVADGAEKLVYWASPGERWLDVNLSNYTITGYEGATVVKGPYPIVIGKPSTPTVTGTYRIERRYASKTMRGADYVTENVPWAQYFVGGYAVHGAYWRSSFGYGGARGSHGCVNMAVSQAKELYQWNEIGDIVVSHY